MVFYKYIYNLNNSYKNIKEKKVIREGNFSLVLGNTDTVHTPYVCPTWKAIQVVFLFYLLQRWKLPVQSFTRAYELMYQS